MLTLNSVLCMDKEAKTHCLLSELVSYPVHVILIIKASPAPRVEREGLPLLSFYLLIVLTQEFLLSELYEKKKNQRYICKLQG